MSIKKQWEIQQKTALEKTIIWAGGIPTLKQILGLKTTSIIHGWVKNGRVPIKYAPLIELLSVGLIKKQELRPDQKWD